MAGLPGSGLGGLFYVLLVAWMFVRQLLSGNTSREQWRPMIPLALMSVGMLAVLAVEAWAVTLAVGRLPRFADFVAPSDTTGRWAFVLGFTPVLSIAALLLVLQITRLLVPRETAR
jgi:hypothetical protein